jgi:dienelactone hydrolase
MMIFGSTLAPAQTGDTAKFVARSHTYQGNTIPYRLFVPEGYIPATHYPVILFLHGSSAIGTDNVRQLNVYATRWADSALQAVHPCFVVVPQTPETWSFDQSPSLRTANNILDSLGREFSLDSNRFYVEGGSMGGYGTWDLISHYPNRFAAAVPNCGGGNPAYVDAIGDVSIWNFHGALDNTVPVSESRVIIGAMQNAGRTLITTECLNAESAGPSDTAISMAVRSHEDFLYTECPYAGHGECIEGPIVIPWVFDQYRKTHGAITLTNLKSHRTLTGMESITWKTASPGDSVEIWFTPDAGVIWHLLTRSAPNIGAYQWNTATAEDCSFGQIKIFLRRVDGSIYGVDRSGFFSISNGTSGRPFVRILNSDFCPSRVVSSDSLDLRMRIGDSRSSPLAVMIFYSPDGGTTFSQVDAYSAVPDTLVQTRRIGLSFQLNSSTAMLMVQVTNGTAVTHSMSSPFQKQSPRVKGPTPRLVSGEGGGSVVVYIVDPLALTGHQYRVTFETPPFSPKAYNVRDMNRGVDVVQHAGPLDGVTESPLFDGLLLVVRDTPQLGVNSDSTRWAKGRATMHVQIAVAKYQIGSEMIEGAATRYDYRITLYNGIVDTSKEAYAFSAAPMKFSVWNLTRNKKVDVLFADADGDNTISSFDELAFLEPDSTGKLQLTWSMLFVAESGDILPVAGDEFLLKTLKPITSTDVYEFTGTLSSVAAASVPVQFSLAQNYPNPFNPTTVVRYELPLASSVRLAVYDILGREVSVLVNERREAGVHEVKFDGGGLASGVYFYRLQAGSFTETNKLLLLR